METYRTKSKQDGWERSVFSSIKDEAVDLWATHGEKKVVIEMQDNNMVEKEPQMVQKAASSKYPEYRLTPTSTVRTRYSYRITKTIRATTKTYWSYPSG